MPNCAEDLSADREIEHVQHCRSCSVTTQCQRQSLITFFHRYIMMPQWTALNVKVKACVRVRVRVRACVYLQ